jgi:hypothetical protein
MGNGIEDLEGGEALGAPINIVNSGLFVGAGEIAGLERGKGVGKRMGVWDGIVWEWVGRGSWDLEEWEEMGSGSAAICFEK